MAALMKTAYDGYRYIFYECADPRVADWFLLGSPLYPVGLIAAYLYFVKVAGPQYMKNRSAFQLSGIVFLYNVIQIVLNAILFLKAIEIGRTVYKYCSVPEYSYNPEDMYMMRGYWEYFMLKILDLMDTIFFVLRKRNNQVTTLHVYHHTVMVLGTWVIVKMGSGGHELVLGLMNTLAHVFMYSYYLAANIRPEYKNNIWWKKYITQLQMIQFAINFVYFFSGVIVPNCQYPRLASIFHVVQNLVMLLMFIDFYRKAYRKQKQI